MSDWGLLREPDERKERIGGMVGRPGVEEKGGDLYDIGGRDLDIRGSDLSSS